MNYRPANTHTERRGSRVRLYASPKFVRPDGVTWRPIEDVVSVERDEATGAYRVMCGDEWITFTPRVRRGQLAQSVVSKTHFGDILTPDSGYDGVVEYDIAYSSRVEHTTAGWQFTDISDVPLGVFLSDWRGRFGDRVSIGSDRASVDLAGIEPDLFGQINLDPVIIEHAADGGAARVALTWPDVRNGDGIFSIFAAEILTGEGLSGDYACARGAVRFDTSGYPQVGSAVFKFTPLETLSGFALMPAADVHVSRASITSYGEGSTPLAVYGEVMAGYEANPWGVMYADGEKYAYDLTAHYESTATLDIGLANYTNDVGNSVPTIDQAVRAYIPYLEIVLPGRDGLALTGAGK